MKKILLIASMFACGGTFAQETEDVLFDAVDEAGDLFSLDFEDLLNMQVTSVSKKAERLQDVASSIYVVTATDIQHSGATTLIEILRTVPGFWAMQDEYSNGVAGIRNSPVQDGNMGTVLYLLDGTPLQDLMGSTFSFRNFDIPLDEIDRIEVIRGSGGTVYGANSATGVVNIFTKTPDKYDGINVRAEGAAPGYAAVSVRAGKKITEKLAVSGYAKYRHFDGFGSVSRKDENGNTIRTPSRFTENFDKQAMMSYGLKGTYEINSKSKISLNTHYNTLQKIDYTNSYEPMYVVHGQDVLYKNDVNSSRFVGNLRYDHTFNENHSIFARVSSNMENDFKKIGGGHKLSNAIYDLEIQDNISIGKRNDLSIGLNYRAVNIDLHGFNDQATLQYLLPQNSEVITGAFIQDKIKLIDDKLNVVLGLKAENYTLINDKYYFSPMAKVAFIPVKNVTFWGGFTQSYTTPGYNTTNLDLMLLQMPDFVPNPSYAVKNGRNTVPTKFQSWEAGVKTNLDNKVLFESNFYHITTSDAIGTSTAWNTNFEESPTRPGQMSAYFYYGNYMKGTTMGTETMMKFLASSGITLEIAHTWMESYWQLQKNEDFDLNDVATDSRSQTPKVPTMPQHVFRVKGYFDLPENFKMSMAIIYTTKYRTAAEYNYGAERYRNVVQEVDPAGVSIIAEDNHRTIINLRIEKAFMDKKLTVYAFGNDIFNQGLIAYTDRIYNVTVSQIKGMYGLGANYKF